jgi:hypothetical protein
VTISEIVNPEGALALRSDSSLRLPTRALRRPRWLLATDMASAIENFRPKRPKPAIMWGTECNPSTNRLLLARAQDPARGTEG